MAYSHDDGPKGVRLSESGATAPKPASEPSWNPINCKGTPPTIKEWRDCQQRRNIGKPKAVKAASNKCTAAEWRNAPYTLEIELAFFSDPEEYKRTWRCKGEIRQVSLHRNRTGRDRSDALQLNRCLLHLRERGAVGDVLTVEQATDAAARC